MNDLRLEDGTLNALNIATQQHSGVGSLLVTGCSPWTIDTYTCTWIKRKAEAHVRRNHLEIFETAPLRVVLALFNTVHCTSRDHHPWSSIAFQRDTLERSHETYPVRVPAGMMSLSPTW